MVDLEEIISSVLAMRENSEVTLPDIRMESLPKICGCKSQLQMLFKNLIENAIRYNDSEPVISICSEENVDAGSHVITIKDNGIGMDNDYIDKIFTPFARLNSNDQYKGSGLGLSIVKKMVMNHGGDIRVVSAVGEGSTFYVSLPINAPKSDH